MSEGTSFVIVCLQHFYTPDAVFLSRHTMLLRCLSDGRRKETVIFGLIFGVVSIVYLLLMNYTEMGSEVGTTYFEYARDLLNGSISNLNFLPGASVFMVIPKLFATTSDGYIILFVIETYVFFVIGLILAGKLAKRFEQNPYFAMLAYSVMMLVMFQFVVDRYDIFPMVFTMLAVYCFVTKRYVWVWIILCIAMMTKLYPAVLVPVFLTLLFVNKEWKNALKGMIIFFGLVAAIVLPIMMFGSDTIFNFAEYHMNRPLQIESTAASVISFAAILGLTSVTVVYSYFSDNLIGAWPDAVSPYLTPLMIAMLVILYIVYAHLSARNNKRDFGNESNRMILLGATMFASVAIFVLVEKVFSAQYMIWLIPFVLFLLLMPLDRVLKKWITILFLAAEALTQLNYLVNIELSQGPVFDDVGMMVILIRNIVMIALLYLVLSGVWKRFAKTDTSISEN